MKTPSRTIKEKNIVNEQAREIRFMFVEHPLLFISSQVINKITLPSENHFTKTPQLTFALSRELLNEEVHKNSKEELALIIQEGVLEPKSIVEQRKA